MNPNFSSTDGLQIYMSRFSKVKYNGSTETVDVGAGCVWDEVYRAMAKVGRNVVGGASAQGVGVAGYLLGGGFSLKTNQYGLGIDNIIAIQIVLPNGEILDVNEQYHGDLFQALKVSMWRLRPQFVLKVGSTGRGKQLRDCYEVHAQDSSTG